MSRNLTITLGAALLWAGSLAGAYHFGKRQAENAVGASAGGASVTTAGGGTSGGRASRPAGAGGAADSAEKPLSVKQILARMKSIMRGGAMQNPSAMMKVMALLDKIRPEDVQEALAEAESMNDPQQKMMLYMALLGKWAEHDGPGAMKYADDHSKSLGLMAQVAKMSVASTWAEKDPEAVWKWYQETADKDGGGMLGGGSMVLMSLFSSMAANDPEAAFRRLDEIEGTGRQMALAGMFQSALFDDERREAILRKVESLPDEADRQQARQMMLSQWTMLAPDQAMEWVIKQPADQQGKLRESVGASLMMSDPKKGAGFLLEGASDEEKPKRYAQIVGQWAAMDTNAAGTWLREQPQGPHLDEARQSFVGAASQKDPESAMAWAGTITNPDQRVNATSTAYRFWKKKDAVAADQALMRSGLSEDQINAVRSESDGQPLPNAR